MGVAPCRHNALSRQRQEGRRELRHFSSAALKKKTKSKKKNKPTTLCRDDKTPQCQYNAPCLSPPEKEKGKRGTVSFITAKGKGKAPSFARQKVFLGLRVVAPEASRGDLSIGDIAATLTDSHHERRPATLKKASFRKLYFFFFFASSTTIGRFLQVKSVLT